MAWRKIEATIGYCQCLFAAMPVITSITLQMSNFELSDDDGTSTAIEKVPKTAPHLFNAVNTWLIRMDEWPLRLLGNESRIPREDCFGGTRRPYIQIAAGGYRNFLMGEDHLEEQFREFILALPWKYPEEVVLIMTSDVDQARVYRPPFRA